MKTETRGHREGGRGPALVGVIALAAGLAPVACKKTVDRESSSPYRALEQWTLAEIEAELDRNGDVLQSEGIMVASIDPGLTAGSPTTDGAVYDQAESADEDDGAGAGAEPIDMVESEPPPSDDYAEPATASAVDMDRMEAEAPADRRSRRRRVSRADRRAASSRCTRICELAEATCELEAQICALAEEHTDEPRYTRACMRAEQQCIAAARHCDRCED